jgi:hypothetical protein
MLTVTHVRRRYSGLTREDFTVRDPRNIVIAILALAVIVLGYLYYDSQQHRISVDLPGFKLDAK